MKVKFEKEKETKRTIRFKEILPGTEDAPMIGMIYIPKQTLQDIGYKDGDTVVVDLTVAE